jgi:hypothetical protein
MLQKYLFIPVVASILGGLIIWSHNLAPKIQTTSLSQKSPEMRLIQPRRMMSSAQSPLEPPGLEFEPQDLEIELLESN